MTDEELVKRLRNAKVTQDFRHTLEDEAANRIEELEGKIARVERANDALEGLRPVWAQGWTNDSMAAQASGNALAQLWKMLGAQDQTQAVATLKALTEQLEAARADAKEAEAYAEELEKERDRWREIANNEAVEGEANRNAGLALEAKLAKAVEVLQLYAGGVKSAVYARTALAELEGK